ncbi:MAG: Hsp20/alpha crystallin family protein [Phycisphaerae bacterium]|nr:Hsp20/alpha crystallin family protein [Phycisphaerae bacterium]
MSTLIRRDPFNEMPAFGRLVSQFFNDPMSGDLAVPTLEEGNLALDISEDEKSLVVRASLPGFRKEDVEVEVHDGVLSITAQRGEEHETKNERFYRKERRMSSVSRRIALPASVAESDTKAELKDGVLTLRLPKMLKAQGTKVRIG